VVEPARPAALTRRHFLTLAAAAAALPVVAGCDVAKIAAAAPARAAAPGPAPTFTADGIRPQVDTPAPSASPAGYQVPPLGEAAALRPDSLLVLSYHNICADGGAQPADHDHYTVSAGAFAGHVDLLRRAGFHSVSLSEVGRAARSGRPLPPGSVLITFDDGDAGQWIYADRILAAAGFTAAAFVITSHLGADPAHLTWPETVAMARNGRWEIGAHTHDHHHFVRTSGSTDPASVLINRIWDPVTGLQTTGAARAAFEADLQTSLAMVSAAGIARPQAFAYPFSQSTSPTNDPAFATHVRQRLSATFPLLFTNTSPGRAAQPQDLRSGMVPRLEVHRDMSALDLYDQIRAADAISGIRIFQATR